MVLLGWSGISCAGSKEIPLAAADRAQIGTAESVQVVRRSPVGLILQKSPDDMVWGDLATARQLERGGQWRQQYGVVDPVLRTAERLGAAFHDDFGAPLVLPVIEIGSDDPQAIAASVC